MRTRFIFSLIVFLEMRISFFSRTPTNSLHVCQTPGYSRLSNTDAPFLLRFNRAAEAIAAYRDKVFLN